MPKRHHENSLEFICNKLRKLEKEVKRSRKSRSNCVPSSPSSTSSNRSSSSSSCSSRSASPDNLENTHNQEETTRVEIHNDTTEVPPSKNVELPTIILSGETLEEVPKPSTSDGTAPDPDIVQILGADPSISEDYGPDINKDVATRFAHIATSGLDKNIRKDLITKYLIPANCKAIGAPQLNAEIKAALSEQVIKRDKAIEARQKQMAVGISFLAKIITDQFGATHKNNDLIKDLMEVGRIFCDLQHSESETRRQFALYTVKKDLKDQLISTKIDKFLFGSDFLETLKTAKAVSKSSSDLKPYASKKPKKPSKNQNLNWKARTSARRQPPAQTPMYQPPVAPPAAPRANSSRNYTPRHKQTRRQ